MTSVYNFTVEGFNIEALDTTSYNCLYSQSMHSLLVCIGPGIVVECVLKVAQLQSVAVWHMTDSHTLNSSSLCHALPPSQWILNELSNIDFI